MKIGVLGTGPLGAAVARRLAGQGFDVSVWNRTMARAEATGLPVADSPADLATGVEALVTVLSNDDVVASVLGLEEGLITRGGAELHVCLSTLSTGLTARFGAAHVALDQHFIAAPVFGIPAAAEAGQLAVMAGGPAAGIARARPVLEALGRAVFVTGEDPTTAVIAKMTGNALMASFLESAHDALRLAEAAGIARETYAEILGEALFPTPFARSIAARLVGQEGDPPNPFRKSVLLSEAEARRLGLDLPIIARLAELLTERGGPGKY